MSDITKQAVDAVLNAADNAAGHAITIIASSLSLAASALEAPIDVGEATAEAVLDQARGLIAEAFELLREVATAVTDPLP